MPMYITLYNWTEQGIRNVKDAPARIRATCQSAEAAGGRVLGVFLTMGQYDLVAVSEAPDDESYAAWLGQHATGIRNRLDETQVAEQWRKYLESVAGG